MNPLTKVKLINELNEREADLGVKESVSWHTEYKDSAWIFVGGFPFELTEGDIICVFSQYGEVVNINLVRDKKTGKSKGFCFICYEDQRSTILAVDNFNGIKIKGRTIRVDHVKDYRPPKDSEDIDDITKHLRDEGCAPTATKSTSSSSSSSEEDEQYVIPVKKLKKDKKEKKKKKKKKKKAEQERGSRVSSSASPPLHRTPPAVRVKEEKEDTAYDKYNQRGAPPGGQLNGQRAGEEAERRRNHEREGEREEDRQRDDRREGDRQRREREGDRRRETDRDDRRETDRDGETRKETDRDRDDRRRETDRDSRRERDDDRRQMVKRE
ncbi:RNA-binding motif protein, X-linked 2 isoform X3 [Hippoglossus hippoglossus]|uniref:RNA-binding motif protein, X-linked 2 isoform X3 n=1 Tax=Hippoglossus hippoglossus TaxID=8267 RepID=UPI00148B8DC5|nr:RNA-binding motif protein, X-linked 2 isoform X3 [Hippoglossus hippoglossus]